VRSLRYLRGTPSASARGQAKGSNPIYEWQRLYWFTEELTLALRDGTHSSRQIREEKGSSRMYLEAMKGDGGTVPLDDILQEKKVLMRVQWIRLA